MRPALVEGLEGIAQHRLESSQGLGFRAVTALSNVYTLPKPPQQVK